jgi:hypothetical protein
VGLRGCLPLLRSLWVRAIESPGFTPGAIFFASFRGI